MPAPLFSTVYMDTMHMPSLSGYKYIVQGCCSLIYWPEWAMLSKENTVALGKWILHDIIYRWGLLLEIITNNGPAFLKALAYLEKHYHIKHIRISRYNSHANGIVERSHFEVREAIFTACDRDELKWSGVAYSVFWAERVTIRCRMRCSPYFSVTGTHPLLPIDIVEANYLLLPSESILSSTNLITQPAITLQKRCDQLSKLMEQVYQARVSTAIRFEKKHWHTIHNYNFQLGDLALIRNIAIKKALDCKMRPQYLGPLIVISRNEGGAYIISELDGSVFDRPMAAFQVIPYSARRKLKIPPLEELINISQKRLQELKDSKDQDPKADDEAYSKDFENYW